jgi:hypothetical protein
VGESTADWEELMKGGEKVRTNKATNGHFRINFIVKALIGKQMTFFVSARNQQQ